ncbi:hypothetical protein BGZ65_012922 [Modicella reniformis]|uniref:Uncharacterized protein n=1 Tax=Modicella reniformis TaxID=1440133 RepID=A0A9P6MJN5_9FUNG|nr:hypothetical protein BGZ65_012922 [Modicella reniformis]
MASCTRLNTFFGFTHSSRGCVSSLSKSCRFYTASSSSNTASSALAPAPAPGGVAAAAAAATTKAFVRDPTFKSTAGLNQSKHNPKFKTQTAELPNISSRAPLYILAGIVGVAFWAGSLAVAANHQRQGTSVVRGTLFNVKFDAKAQELLGDNIDFTNKGWPWISGTVAHLKGRVNIEYQVRGDKAEGRVHFVAVRPAKQWVTTDFTLTMPDGTCVPLGESTILPELKNN